jgi:hypothetical protein
MNIVITVVVFITLYALLVYATHKIVAWFDKGE